MITARRLRWRLRTREVRSRTWRRRHRRPSPAEADLTRLCSARLMEVMTSTASMPRWNLQRLVTCDRSPADAGYFTHGDHGPRSWGTAHRQAGEVTRPTSSTSSDSTVAKTGRGSRSGNCMEPQPAWVARRGPAAGPRQERKTGATYCPGWVGEPLRAPCAAGLRGAHRRWRLRRRDCHWRLEIQHAHRRLSFWMRCWPAVTTRSPGIRPGTPPARLADADLDLDALGDARVLVRPVDQLVDVLAPGQGTMAPGSRGRPAHADRRHAATCRAQLQRTAVDAPRTPTERPLASSKGPPPAP